MKLILLLILPFNLLAQLIKTDSFLIAKTSVNDFLITNTLKEVNFDEISNSLRLDVFSYYELHEKYDTELKKSIFKKSNEYSEKLNELIEIKKSCLNNCRYIEISKEEGFKIYDYDVNKKGFLVNLGFKIKSEVNYFSDKYELKSIPIKISISDSQGMGELYFDRKIFFPCNENDASLLENERDIIKLYVIFKPLGVKKVKNLLFLGYYDDYITTNFIRFIIINSKTNKIYFDKNFSIPKSSKN
ncbi:MAG: hypothetical protein H7239_11635 [Flavobacterium sp.]|nr:hypothetical protein [Flavobacterium sp.]